MNLLSLERETQQRKYRRQSFLSRQHYCFITLSRLDEGDELAGALDQFVQRVEIPKQHSECVGAELECHLETHATGVGHLGVGDGVDEHFNDLS